MAERPVLVGLIPQAVVLDAEDGPAFSERSAVVQDAPSVPVAPFYGVRVKKDWDLREVFPYINETALFKNQWQLKTASQEDYVRIWQRCRKKPLPVVS